MPSYFLGKFTEYPEKNIGSPLISAKLNLIYKKHNKHPTLHFLGCEKEADPKEDF